MLGLFFISRGIFGTVIFVEKKADFIWLRQANPKDDQIIFIARKSYTFAEDFTQTNLIKFRDDICRNNLFEDPVNNNSFLLTETTVPFIPVTSEVISMNKHFSVKLQGIWRSNTNSIGGPFEGIAIVDESTNQFYYIEGFTYGPAKEQREIMRRLEAILYTFKTSEDLHTIAASTDKRRAIN